MTQEELMAAKAAKAERKAAHRAASMSGEDVAASRRVEKAVAQACAAQVEADEREARRQHAFYAREERESSEAKDFAYLRGLEVGEIGSERLVRVEAARDAIRALARLESLVRGDRHTRVDQISSEEVRRFVVSLLKD